MCDDPAKDPCAKLLAYAEGRIDLPPPLPTHLLIDA
jgi:hypothetical protein